MGCRRDFYQHTGTDPRLAEEVRGLLKLAIWEDNGENGDITSRALIPEAIPGGAIVAVREEGVAAGMAVAPLILEAVDPELVWTPIARDGDAVRPGMKLGTITGPVLTMLTAERLLLNLVGRLSGIASLTRTYVDRIAGTKARIYDTRKTTLGWRFLEKYAVHCGGGCNHRTGLFDAMLIKDNHLAFAHETGLTPAEAVRRGKAYVEKTFASVSESERPLIEVEVDSLEQLKDVLTADPDIVLLDNMSPALMKEAVRMRDGAGSRAELEASGGINLNTVRAAAESGVDRVSVGALTHSARSLDIGLDWDEYNQNREECFKSFEPFSRGEPV